MQDLLSQLDPPIAITIIIVGILALVGVVLLARRRRPPPADEISAGGLGGPIDYTSIPLDEGPQSFRDRFNNLSVAGKVLAVLVPVLAILALVVLVLTLLPDSSAQQAGPLPTVEPITLTITKSDLIRVDPTPAIGVNVDSTGLVEGTELQVELRDSSGQPFPWLNSELARGQLRSNGTAEILIPRAADAPRPVDGEQYTVVVSTSDGSVSQESPLVVPPIYAAGFLGQVAAAPTATAAPTNTPAPEPTPAAEPTAAPEPTAALPTGQPAGVAGGGNVRRLPFLADNVIGGVNAGEEVQLLARTPNGQWYRVRTVRDEIGWVSASLLVVDGSTASGVTVAPVVSVFENGAVYEQADLGSTQLDRVNGSVANVAASEVVELLRKSADSSWYEVTNVRGITGWVPAELLGIPAEVAAAVPVAE